MLTERLKLKYQTDVDVLRLQTTVDENKVSKKSYVLFATIKGKLSGLRGDRIIINDKYESVANFSLNILKGTELLYSDILVIDGRQYEIRNINDSPKTHTEILLKNKN